MLDIPHAKYNFAIWQDQDGNSRRGVVSLSFLDGEDGFLPWLFYQDPAKGQTLERVLELWQHYAIIENFVGYIMLDAWIGNTDRHAENWGTVVHVNDEAHKSRKFEATLAPTFDHASSLGVRLSDDDRKRRLTTRDTRQNVAAYAARCKTPFSATINGSVQKNLKTHQVFEYLARRCTKIAHFWLDRLNDIPKDDIESVFSRVPRDRMTETAAEFAIALLNENRRQLMRLKGELK